MAKLTTLTPPKIPRLVADSLAVAAVVSIYGGLVQQQLAELTSAEAGVAKIGPVVRCAIDFGTSERIGYRDTKHQTQSTFVHGSLQPGSARDQSSLICTRCYKWRSGAVLKTSVPASRVQDLAIWLFPWSRDELNSWQLLSVVPT